MRVLLIAEALATPRLGGTNSHRRGLRSPALSSIMNGLNVGGGGGSGERDNNVMYAGADDKKDTLSKVAVK